MEREIKLKYNYFERLEEAPEDYRSILKEAKIAKEKAYAPYSKFRVGSALLLESGKIIHGSNQENMAYPDGLCAERTALFAYGANHADEKIIRLGIVGDGDLLDENGILSPCGSCRQVMAEFTLRQKQEFEIVMLNGNDSVISVSGINELLPLTFGTKH